MTDLLRPEILQRQIARLAVVCGDIMHDRDGVFIPPDALFVRRTSNSYRENEKHLKYRPSDASGSRTA
jgi:hypothetical protein